MRPLPAGFMLVQCITSALTATVGNDAWNALSRPRNTKRTVAELSTGVCGVMCSRNQCEVPGEANVWHHAHADAPCSHRSGQTSGRIGPWATSFGPSSILWWPLFNRQLLSACFTMKRILYQPLTGANGSSVARLCQTALSKR